MEQLVGGSQYLFIADFVGNNQNVLNVVLFADLVCFLQAVDGVLVHLYRVILSRERDNGPDDVSGGLLCLAQLSRRVQGRFVSSDYQGVELNSAVLNFPIDAFGGDASHQIGDKETDAPQSRYQLIIAQSLNEIVINQNDEIDNQRSDKGGKSSRQNLAQSGFMIDNIVVSRQIEDEHHEQWKANLPQHDIRKLVIGNNGFHMTQAFRISCQEKTDSNEDKPCQAHGEVVTQHVL